MSIIEKLLIDKVNQVLGANSVTFSNIVANGPYKTATANIKFSKIFPGMLMLIGAELGGLPITISAIKTTTQDHLFSGNITLTVLGE